MNLRTTTGLVIVAALFASCGGDDDDQSGDGNGGDGASAEESTTTTVPVDYQPVIDAKLEGHSQYEAARANPTNPENPVLRDYFTDVALLNVISDQVFNSSDTINAISTVYPEDSQHRFEIESVTFSDADPNVAWLETCWVDDGVDRYTDTGEVADIFDTPPIRTLQRTEEMRKEGGNWKTARVFVNTYQESVTGCGTADDYEQDHSAQSPSRDVEQTITDQRTAAEQAYVQYLINPNYNGYPETWTGFQHDLYFANPGPNSDGHRNPQGNYCPPNATWIVRNGQNERLYQQDDTLNPWMTNPYYRYENSNYSQSPCYNDYQLGQNAWSFSIRGDGTTFDPATTSTVAVETVQLQSIDNPDVAYLTTCRTYNLTPTGQGDYPHRQGTVQTTETMHLIDGTWKVSNRWAFTSTDTCT